MFSVSPTTNFVVYALFPGQKLFLSVMHPQKSFNNIEVKGSKIFMITITPSFTVHLEDKTDCFKFGSDYSAVLKAQLQYEDWYE